MDSHQLIDAQFDRAVEIVQGLPKIGPIQTGYEDKLTMYSLYKQATVGNVQPPRPGVWEVLARAKWDAWAKHKDLDQYEAKWLYVDTLLKVLRKYSDKTVAMDLVRELESYNGDASNLVMSGSLGRSRASSSSSSSSGHAGPSGSPYSSDMPAHLRNNVANRGTVPDTQSWAQEVDARRPASTDEGESDDGEQRPLVPLPQVRSHIGRPQSSMSSHRYRTPLASMLMSPPLMSMSVPPTQPMPPSKAPSAYAEPAPSRTSHSYPPSVASYPANYPMPTPPASGSHHDSYIQPPYHSASQLPYPPRQHTLPGGTVPRVVLERAVENLQTHFAALSERIESLESAHLRSSASLVSQNGSNSEQWRLYGRGVSPSGRGESHNWDVNDMGMWSLVLDPLSRIVARFKQLMEFIMYNENRSPTFVVIRRLFLDISFLLCLLATVKMAWSRSGVRRKEIMRACQGLWWAIVGRKQQRILVHRAV